MFISQFIFNLYVLFFGLAVGSFLNVCIHRMPQNKTLGGRSQCPHCKTLIRWYQNIPVLSFLFLKGRCGTCHQSISPRYVFVELLTSLLALATWTSVNHQILPFLLWFCFFGCPLIVISFIDLKERIIPDCISLPGIPISIAVILVVQWPQWKEALQFSFLGILVGGGALLTLALIYYKLRKKEGMGGGDIKLSAMLGGFLGWQGIFFVFFVSSILALVASIFILLTQKKEHETFVIPYGPFLAIASLIYFFYGSQIISNYFEFMGLPPPHHFLFN